MKNEILNQVMKNAFFIKAVEIINIDDLSSGMLKTKGALSNVAKFLNGEILVRTDDGRTWKAGKRLKAVDLKKGMVIASSYSADNQGFAIEEILGISDNDKKYGQGGPKFDNVKEILKKHNKSTLLELENDIEDKPEYGHGFYLCTRDLSEMQKREGCWYYLYKGRWARGSGAETLSFVEVKEV